MQHILRTRVGLLLLLLPSVGCGTICNLKDPGDGDIFMGSATCYPFGGVTRSAMRGRTGPPLGVVLAVDGNSEICKGNVNEGIKKVGAGTGLAIAGVVSIADVPLSLAGDIVTLPVAYARQQGKPWATWWGNQQRYPGPNSIVPLIPMTDSPPPVAASQTLAPELQELERVSDLISSGGGSR